MELQMDIIPRVLILRNCLLEPKAKLMPRSYLGDGLYVDYDGYQIELVTNNGVKDQDRVFLEPSVLDCFLAYLFANGLLRIPKGENK